MEYIYYLASQDPGTQTFMVDNGHALLKMGFSLFHALTLSQKSIGFHNFILTHFDRLHEAELDRVNIEHLAGRSITEQNFVLKHFEFLYDAGVSVRLIFYLATQEETVQNFKVKNAHYLRGARFIP
ncbi:hypothetical protein SODG_007237 [Sodalis praecaptivus]